MSFSFYATNTQASLTSSAFAASASYTSAPTYGSTTRAMAALDATQVVAAPQKKRNSAFLDPLGTSNDRTRRAKGPFVKTPRLPKNHTDSLTARIKRLVSLWADEEIMNGNQVFYWNIMTNAALDAIAETVPQTIEELSELGVLGENIVQEYGERLIQNIKAFIEHNALQVYVEQRESKMKNYAIPENAERKMMKQEAKKLEDFQLLQTENETLKQRLKELTEENNNLKRRSQDVTDGLERLLKQSRTIDVID